MTSHRQDTPPSPSRRATATADAHRAIQKKAEAVQLYTSYSRSGSNPALKAFATEVLPTIEMHHKQVGQLD